jgi:expansin
MGHAFLRAHSILVLGTLILFTCEGCTPENASNPGSTGGASAQGGAATGGLPSTGGIAPTGGTSSGGAPMTGGSPSNPTGGTATGGRSTGGSATGGASTGGKSTGGTATGGRASGGSASGGRATGGSGTSGSCNFSSFASYSKNGSATYYDPSGQVNCSFPMSGSNVTHVATGSGAYIAALAPADYKNAAACGACVQVSRDDGRSVTVTIVDSCPSCGTGHIDLSRTAFLQIGTVTEGYLGTGNGGAVGIISWKYVPCPVQGNVTIALKEPTNPGWNEFLVEDSRTPVAKFEAYVNGSWVTGTRQSYNYFNVGSSLSFPIQVRLTDTNGNVIQGTLQSGVAEQDLGAQFPACG